MALRNFGFEYMYNKYLGYGLKDAKYIKTWIYTTSDLTIAVKKNIHPENIGKQGLKLGKNSATWQTIKFLSEICTLLLPRFNERNATVQCDIMSRIHVYLLHGFISI